MSTIIIITPPKKQNLVGDEATEDSGDTTIRIKIEGEGSVSEVLREAADIIDGNA